MNWTEFLKGEAEVTYRATAKLIDKVDAGRLEWKPATGSNWMTMGQLLKHITEACGASSRGMVTGDWGLPEGKSPDDLPPADKFPGIRSPAHAIALLEQDRALAIQMIDRAGEENLATKKMTAPWSGGAPMILGLHLLRMIQHLDRHKSQLFYYLKLQGAPVNTADLWG